MAFSIPFHELWCGPANDESDAARPTARGAASLPTAPAQNDASLIARVRSGDPSALAELFDALYISLTGFSESLTGSASLAEELVQEAFLRVWAARDRWVVRDTVRAYFFGAVRNLARNTARHRMVETRYRLDGFAEENAVDGTADSVTVRIVEGLELQEAVMRALERLTPRRRMVLELRWFHGLTHPEVAAALGISVKGVEQTITRALRDLRTLLAAYDPDRTRTLGESL
jgi:RNA polymerase sigma-70 factor (ECF subfamily)